MLTRPDPTRQNPAKSWPNPTRPDPTRPAGPSDPWTTLDWMLSYFENREHSTKFLGSLSTKKSINASVVQGSSLGPCSFSVVAADLKPQNDCFHMFKFADDMNLTTATDNYDKIGDELNHVESWAKENNMSLNKTKTKGNNFQNQQNEPPNPAANRRYPTCEKSETARCHAPRQPFHEWTC